MRPVDISKKIESLREARAYGRILLKKETVSLIKEKKLPKGDLKSATELAGIISAKKTSELLPFCHPVNVDFISLEVHVGEDRVEVFSQVGGIAKTGYEMEALTAVSLALLNVYDMCKALDDTMVIEEIKLIDKKGGKSDWYKDLKGVTFNVLSPFEKLGNLIHSYMDNLGAKFSKDASILIIVGEPFEIKERINSFESVVALYDFKRNPSQIDAEIRIGKDRQGRLVLIFPPSEEKIRFFFETFGGILRSIV